MTGGGLVPKSTAAFPPRRTTIEVILVVCRSQQLVRARRRVVGVVWGEPNVQLGSRAD